MPNEDVPNPPDDQLDNPGLIDQMLLHEHEPAGNEGTEFAESGQTHEQIGDLVTDTIVENPDTSTSDDPDEGREKDYDRALDMAHSAVDEREDAAKRREYAKTAPRKGYNYVRMPSGRNQDVTSREQHLDSAEAYDKRADEIENWAGILHDHPISDRYRDLHPKINFEPGALFRLENDVNEALSDVEKLEEIVKDAPAEVGVWGFDEVKIFEKAPLKTNRNGDLRPYALMVQAFGTVLRGQPVNPKWTEYVELVKDENTTVGQLRDIYLEAFRVLNIEPDANIANSANSVLEDIRSGRASE